MGTKLSLLINLNFFLATCHFGFVTAYGECTNTTGGKVCSFPAEHTPSNLYSKVCSDGESGITFFCEAVTDVEMDLNAGDCSAQPDNISWWYSSNSGTTWSKVGKGGMKQLDLPAKEMTNKKSGCYKCNCTNAIKDTYFNVTVKEPVSPKLLVCHNASTGSNNFTLCPQPLEPHLNRSSIGIICIHANSTGYPEVAYEWEYSSSETDWKYVSMIQLACIFSPIDETSKVHNETACFVPTCENYKVDVIINYKCSISNLNGSITVYQTMNISSLVRDNIWFIRPDFHGTFGDILLKRVNSFYKADVITAAFSESDSPVLYTFCFLPEDVAKTISSDDEIVCWFARSDLNNKFKQYCNCQCPLAPDHSRVQKSRNCDIDEKSKVALSTTEFTDKLGLVNVACQANYTSSSFKTIKGVAIGQRVIESNVYSAPQLLSSFVLKMEPKKEKVLNNIDWAMIGLAGGLLPGILLAILCFCIICICIYQKKASKGKSPNIDQDKIYYQSTESESTPLITEGKSENKGSKTDNVNIPKPRVVFHDTENSDPIEEVLQSSTSESAQNDSRVIFNKTVVIRSSRNYIFRLSDISQGTLDLKVVAQLQDYDLSLTGSMKDLSNSVKRGKELKQKVKGKASDILRGLILDAHMCALIEQAGLLNDDESERLKHMLSVKKEPRQDIVTYFRLVMDKWPLGVYHSMIKKLCIALRNHGDMSNRILGDQLWRDLDLSSSATSSDEFYDANTH